MLENNKMQQSCRNWLKQFFDQLFFMCACFYADSQFFMLINTYFIEKEHVDLNT